MGIDPHMAALGATRKKKAAAARRAAALSPAPEGWMWVRIPRPLQGPDGRWAAGDMVLVPRILVKSVWMLERRYWGSDMESPRPLHERTVKRTRWDKWKGWIRPRPVCKVCRGRGVMALLKHPKRLPAGAVLTNRGFEVDGVLMIPSMQEGTISCPACCRVRLEELHQRRLRRMGARFGNPPVRCEEASQRVADRKTLGRWCGITGLDRMNVRLKCPVHFREDRWTTPCGRYMEVTVTGTAMFEPYESVTERVLVLKEVGRGVRDVVAERMRGSVFGTLVFPLRQEWKEGAD
jgi:hypothetical protein